MRTNVAPTVPSSDSSSPSKKAARLLLGSAALVVLIAGSFVVWNRTTKRPGIDRPLTVGGVEVTCRGVTRGPMTPVGPQAIGALEAVEVSLETDKHHEKSPWGDKDVWLRNAEGSQVFLASTRSGVSTRDGKIGPSRLSLQFVFPKAIAFEPTRIEFSDGQTIPLSSFLGK
jgi:hypothetical protein